MVSNVRRDVKRGRFLEISSKGQQKRQPIQAKSASKHVLQARHHMIVASTATLLPLTESFRAPLHVWRNCHKRVLIKMYLSLDSEFVDVEVCPLHHYCPVGPDSWCRYQKDKDNYKRGSGLPLPILAKVKEDYKRLSDEGLLQKCLHGKTQNQNESLDSLIWQWVSKEVFVG